jgi:hypothetical protein
MLKRTNVITPKGKGFGASIIKPMSFDSQYYGCPSFWCYSARTSGYYRYMLAIKLKIYVKISMLHIMKVGHK